MGRHEYSMPNENSGEVLGAWGLVAACLLVLFVLSVV